MTRDANGHDSSQNSKNSHKSSHEQLNGEISARSLSQNSELNSAQSAEINQEFYENSNNLSPFVSNQPTDQMLNLAPEIVQKIDSLQKELQHNPRSLSFPQLADLYFNHDMIQEAANILERGLKFHPHSVSGMVVYAKVLKARADYKTAEDLLSQAVRLAPQNWQAYLLRADLYVKLKKYSKSLADFKKVLLFNPNHALARKTVAKLEMITASAQEIETEEETDQNFSLTSLQKIEAQTSPVQTLTQASPIQNIHDKLPESFDTTSLKLERILSLVDAFVTRQDYERALKLLHECRSEFGEHYEVKMRLLKLSQYESAEKIRPKIEQTQSASKKALLIEKKQKALELLLRRVNELKNQRIVHT